MKHETWGGTLPTPRGIDTTTLGDSRSMSQVRVLVRARSRAAAARILAENDLFYSPSQAIRFLTVYGSPTGNARELDEVLTGLVYLRSNNLSDGPIVLLPSKVE